MALRKLLTIIGGRIKELPGADSIDVAWAWVTGRPTTIAGYGITDAVNKVGDTMTGQLDINGQALRVRGWGGAQADGVVYFGDAATDHYILKGGGNYILKGTFGTATLNAGGVIWTGNNFNPALKADLTGATFTGAVEAAMLKFNGGGTPGAGTIYTDSNWGMLNWPKVSGLVGAHGWLSLAGTDIMRLTNTGALVLSASGARIQGDFSNATHANRLMFQCSVANTNSVVGIIPNGTAVVAAVNMYSSSDPANASMLQVVCDNTSARVSSTIQGTGTNRPLVLAANLASLTLDTAGNISTNNSMSIGGTAIAFNAKFTVHTPTGTQAFLNLWQAGVGTGGIGFAANSSVMRIVNTYADGLLANGLGIDISSTGHVGIGVAPGTGNATKVKILGGLLTSGSGNQVAIEDRTSLRAWTLYGTADTFRLYNGTGDILTIDANGGFSGGGISDAASSATLVKRHPAGYIFANYFNCTADVTSVVPTQVAVFTGNDNYIRQQTLLAFRQNSASLSTSTSAPADDEGVAKLLRWKNFGTAHTIFDASNSTSPSGVAVNNANSVSPWSATFPTLMGWNGTQTYGVRVDVCRLADSSTALVAGNNYTARDFTVSRNANEGYIYYGTAGGGRYAGFNGAEFTLQGMNFHASAIAYFASTVNYLSANGAAWIRQPRHFVQPGDPGAQSADGDIWTNTT